MNFKKCINYKCADSPVWHKCIILTPEHSTHIDGMLDGGVEVCVITCHKCAPCHNTSTGQPVLLTTCIVDHNWCIQCCHLLL